VHPWAVSSTAAGEALDHTGDGTRCTGAYSGPALGGTRAALTLGMSFTGRALASTVGDRPGRSWEKGEPLGAAGRNSIMSCSVSSLARTGSSTGEELSSSRPLGAALGEERQGPEPGETWTGAGETERSCPKPERR
jgi:hypothetical protein